MRTIVVSVSTVLLVCVAGCTSETVVVVPEGEFLVTVSDDVTEPREAIGALRLSEQESGGMQIALTLAELVWPGEPGGFRAVVFFAPPEARAFAAETDIWTEGMQATYGVDGTQAVREIRRVRMHTTMAGTDDIELSLGPADTVDGSLEPAEWPSAATVHALGSLRITCSALGEPDEFGVRPLVEDPFLVTEFCAGTLEELGLDRLR